MNVPQSAEEESDPIFLRREVFELRDILARIVNSARSTSAAANGCIVHRQLLGEARQVLDEPDDDRICRFMELEALEESDGN